jgi:hypothetical protein
MNNSQASRDKKLFIIYLIGSGLSYFYNPIALLTLSWLLWSRRTQLHSLVTGEWQWIKKQFPIPDYAFLAWLPIIFAGIYAVSTGGIAAQDDLSRHVTSYWHHYDYSRQYDYADGLKDIHFSPWFGFEWLVGHGYALIYKGLAYTHVSSDLLLRRFYALKIVQQIVIGSGLLICGWVFIPLFRSLLRRHATPNGMTGVVIAVLLAGGIGMRIGCGRPELFLMLAMFSVWSIPPRLWVLLMMVLQPLYWLSWIYAVGIIFITRWSIAQRFIALACILCAYGLFWQEYCGVKGVVDFFIMTSQALHSRILLVSENLPAFDYLVSSFGSILIILLVSVFYTYKAQCSKKEYIQSMIFCGFWILLNQARYLLYVTPCLLYILAYQYSLDTDSKKKEMGLKCVGIQSFVGFIIVSVYAVQFSQLQPFSKEIPFFRTMPSQAHVLTSFNASTFVLPALYPTIKMSPPMEVGFANYSVQILLKNQFYHIINYFDCKALVHDHPLFTHLVDMNNGFVPSQVPSCLRLQESVGGWRLWEILKP